MMIPYGYKQTEVGVIPEDWECVKIKDVATISMCKRIFANQTSTIGDVPFYKIGTFGKEADAYISSKLYVEYRNKYSFPQKGDILISAAGTLGRTVIYDGEKAYFQDSNIVWLDINKTRLCNEYLNQYYKVIKWASSEGSTIARLYNGIIYATYISLPPLPEQQRIAEALSDVDGMISSLEKLIAKYKSIKTACLQQMFPQNGETVPRMRLPGFTGAWEQRKLSELASIHARIGWQNLRTSEFLDSGNYMLITGTDFNDGAINFSTCHYVERERYEQDRNIQIHNGSILITKDGTLGKVAYVQGLSMPATLNAGVFNVQIKDANIVDEKYLFQYLKAPYLMDYVSKKATGGTIKHLNQNILVDLPVVMPKKSEQILIGAYFQQLDSLITFHQRKLEKVQKIKQGMMQQLLTGKIRLV